MVKRVAVVFPISPVKITGNRFTGWALDYHTVSSRYDRAGRYYVTDRTVLGEALYNFKYKKRFWLAGKIARTAAKFLIDSGMIDDFSVIIPIPSARFRLLYQPVRLLAKRIGRILDKPVETGMLQRAKKIPPVKSMEDRMEREKAVRGLFSIRPGREIYGNVLLFDDLYRSGATLREAVRALRSLGGPNKFQVLAITKTRVRK